MDGRPPTSRPNSSAVELHSDAPHLRIHAINIFVRDQDRSVRFYVDQLGFDLAFDALLQNGDRWIAVAPPDGSALLSLVAPSPESPDYKLIGRPTGIVFVTEDVVAKYAEWCRRGVQFRFAPRLRRVKFSHKDAQPRPAGAAPESTRLWGGVFTSFRDLDGNSFALVGFDEVNQEIERQRHAAAEKLRAERFAEQELQIAKQVQARLFPQILPSIQTLDYSGTCLQARQVGGDYFDFLDLGLGRFGLVVGDIAGKGMAAALLMANLQANLRIQCAMLSGELQRLLCSVNQVFYSNTTESAYATLFFAEYVDSHRTLNFVNCGHLPALLVRSDNTVERLESTGTVLGLFGEWDCSVGHQAMYPGDMLAVYTDGITESSNDEGDDFGEDRLTDFLIRHRHLSPDGIIAAVVGEVQRFAGDRDQHDDITLTVAKCR
jgi:serine phosphatase RsbU (regulator of sigma subunit)/catechol 2,3-dioxygenase-like lactoylglutathione lyase family enzyme